MYLQKYIIKLISLFYRVSDLCMGVECTQAFLHVRLCETKKLGDGTPAFEDIDLQPIYSTAVMRLVIK